MEIPCRSPAAPLANHHHVLVRPVHELIGVDDPAWPSIAASIEAAASATVLPIDRERGERCMHRLQVTARSALGALALHTGDLLCDCGWLRLLGGGYGGLPDVATVNGLAGHDQGPPGRLEVARDVLGGRFAINGGDLPGPTMEVCYFGPDTLGWQPLGLGHGALVQWALSGGTERFYADLRWAGWQEEIASLGLDEGISVVPPLFSREGKELSRASRRPVPWDELPAMHEEIAKQLADVPPGGRFRIQTRE